MLAERYYVDTSIPEVVSAFSHPYLLIIIFLATMSSSYHIRKAEKDDLPAMIEVSKRAFAGGAMSDALFPEHLRTEDTENEKVQFHLSRHVDKIYDENRHYLVVVDDKDTIAGIALWQTYVETGLNDKEAEEAEKAELRSHFPKSIDLAAAEKIEKLLEVLKKTIKDALGQEEFKNSWSGSNNPHPIPSQSHSGPSM